MTASPWVAVLAGTAVGVCVGLIGTSGAIMIPVLIFGFGLSQLRAQGTALFIAMLPVWIFPVICAGGQCGLEAGPAWLRGSPWGATSARSGCSTCRWA
ncbi:MAG TPA: hypothetical protein VFC39_19430 [Acidobacteriaceae bacterium]|nr:hypothetical protein [Acidobacteriaceae bacterium]